MASKNYLPQHSLINFGKASISDFLREKKFEIKHYSRMDSSKMAYLLCFDIYTYLNRVNQRDIQFFSFIATFTDEINSEEHFDELMQLLLQNMHIIDRNHFVWDKTAHGELCETGYCFSVGGRLFYLTAMHPKSRNKNLRYHKPIIIFNPLESVLNPKSGKA